MSSLGPEPELDDVLFTVSNVLFGFLTSNSGLSRKYFTAQSLALRRLVNLRAAALAQVKGRLHHTPANGHQNGHQVC